jgi:molybdopterin-guanine dinucleotide biosynthesis protein A
MPRFSQVDGFILVGGKSSRMGRDKALLELAGTPLLTRVAALLVPLVAQIMLAGDPQQFGKFGYPVVEDRWPDAGPLGAIATALAASSEPWSFILACDLPYLTGDWLAWLLGRATKTAQSKPVDIFVPETAHGLEPLCAVYRSACAATLAAALDRGVRKVSDSFAGLIVERIAESEWRKFSPDGKLFRNMNTPEDYQEALMHFGR